MTWKAWFALAGVWLLVVIACGVFLQVEYGTLDCTLPSSVPTQESHDDGIAQRVWVPPGTSCVQATGTWYPVGTPNEWNRPGTWRNGAAALLVLTGVALAWGLWREQIVSDEQ